jgi:hypothetical protein
MPMGIGTRASRWEVVAYGEALSLDDRGISGSSTASLYTRLFSPPTPLVDLDSQMFGTFARRASEHA